MAPGMHLPFQIPILVQCVALGEVTMSVKRSGVPGRIHKLPNVKRLPFKFVDVSIIYIGLQAIAIRLEAGGHC